MNFMNIIYQQFNLLKCEMKNTQTDSNIRNSMKIIKPIKTSCNIIGFTFKENYIYFINFCECICDLDFAIETWLPFTALVKNVRR